MTQHFDRAFFSNNRRRLGEQAGADLIVITAHGQMQRNGDNTYPFRQDSSFWYLTGIDEPDLILVLKAGEASLIVPERDYFREAFDGKIDTKVVAETSGIKKVLAQKEGWQWLRQEVRKAQKVATLFSAGSYMPWHGFYTNPARARLLKRLKRVNPKLELEDLRSALARLRMIKQAPELEATQQAIDVTIATLKDVLDRRHSFTYEYEVEAELWYGYRKRGAEDLGFPTIAASGPKVTQIHPMDNNDPLDKKGLLLIDTGVEINHYNSDLARTMAFEKPPVRVRQVYDAVIEVRNFANDFLKPGVTLREYEKAVEACMGKQLKRLGLIQEESRETIRHYFPHATSHFLGLDTHDAGDYDAPLEPNTLLAVEPGIYIPEEGIGMRVEDNVLITEKGIKNLSDSLPRTLF